MAQGALKEAAVLADLLSWNSIYHMITSTGYHRGEALLRRNAHGITAVDPFVEPEATASIIDETISTCGETMAMETDGIKQRIHNSSFKKLVDCSGGTVHADDWESGMIQYIVPTGHLVEMMR